jgi:hypothetical protein
MPFKIGSFNLIPTFAVMTVWSVAEHEYAAMKTAEAP